MEQALPDLFANAQDMFSNLENASTRDPNYQTNVKNAVEAFERCAKLVEQNSLFSSNELLDDIPTTSLKYLSIPFYLAQLYQKFQVPSLERLPLVRSARNLTDSFLKTCTTLQILSKEYVVAYQREGEPDPETSRNEKIARHIATTELKKKISAIMKEKLAKGLSLDDDAGDSEFEREVSLLFIQQSAVEAIDGLKMLKDEIEILEYMSKALAENGGKMPPRAPEPERSPFKPITLVDAKKQIADKAFLPGWNLPTVSIEEAGLVDHKVALQQQKKSQAKEAQDKLVKEYGDPDDDEAPGENNVYKAREWDDWKDQNPKGSGNTGTKGYIYK